MSNKQISEWLQKRIAEVCPPLEDIETDINKRWEAGTPHHPESVKLMKAVEYLDLAFANDYFCWKTGGDGDNGEQMMYLMDIYFEARDKAAQVEIDKKRDVIDRLCSLAAFHGWELDLDLLVNALKRVED